MPSQLNKKISLIGSELVVDIIRKSLWSWFWPLALAVILLLLPFFLIYPLFLQGRWGVAAFSAMLILALILIYHIYRTYYYTALIITTKKLVDMEQSGIFNRSSNVILYDKIQDVNYKSAGLGQTLLGLGCIYISFANDPNSLIELSAIRRPAAVVEKIIKQREDYFIRRRQTAGQEALKMLARIKKKLGEDKFNQLVSN